MLIVIGKVTADFLFVYLIILDKMINYDLCWICVLDADICVLGKIDCLAKCAMGFLELKSSSPN